MEHSALDEACLQTAPLGRDRQWKTKPIRGGAATAGSRSAVSVYRYSHRNSLGRRSMLARLALLFILVPLVELILLIQIGQVVGLWPTIALVVLTGAVGAALARSQGLRTLWAFQEATARGELPADAIQDGLAILVGGAFLLTPGLLTDLVGFGLLLPPTRRWAIGRIKKAFTRRLEDGRIQMAVVVPPMGPPHGQPVDRAEPVDLT